MGRTAGAQKYIDSQEKEENRVSSAPSVEEGKRVMESGEANKIKLSQKKKKKKNDKDVCGGKGNNCSEKRESMQNSTLQPSITACCCGSNIDKDLVKTNLCDVGVTRRCTSLFTEHNRSA